MNKHVFINCPFEGGYTRILHAITFTIISAGFVPRSALEQSASEKGRVGKIADIIRDCPLGIHDISRGGTLSPPGKVVNPRNNMPFELGLFYGAQYFGDATQQEKLSLVFDVTRERHLETFSDLGGKDVVRAHHDDPLQAIAQVRHFLADQISPQQMAGAASFVDKFRQFNRSLPSIAKRLDITVREIKTLEYWKDYVTCVNAWHQRNG